MGTNEIRKILLEKARKIRSEVLNKALDRRIDKSCGCCGKKEDLPLLSDILEDTGFCLECYNKKAKGGGQ